MWRRRTATPAIRTISSACRSTIARATASPAAAARKTIGVSSTTRRSATRSKYIASVSCFGRVYPKCRGTSVRSVVCLAAPVFRPHRVPESGGPDIVTSAPVPRQLPERREPERAAVGRDRRAVGPVSADDGDAPRAFGARSKDRERVVANHVALGEAATTEPPRDPAVIGGEVGARDAVHPELRDRLVIGFEPRVTGCRDHRVGDPFEEALPAGPVVIEASPACGAENVAVPPQQHRIDLRAAGIDREEGGSPHGSSSPGS